MPSYVLKADKDSPYYLMYSTVVDAPTVVYESRADALDDPAITEERLARADATGTSEMFGQYGWDEDTLVFREGAPPAPEGKNGWWVIPRDKLALWCDAFLQDGDGAGEDLLVFEEFED